MDLWKQIQVATRIVTPTHTVTLSEPTGTVVTVWPCSSPKSSYVFRNVFHQFYLSPMWSNLKKAKINHASIETASAWGMTATVWDAQEFHCCFIMLLTVQSLWYSVVFLEQTKQKELFCHIQAVFLPEKGRKKYTTVCSTEKTKTALLRWPQLVLTWVRLCTTCRDLSDTAAM